MTVDIEFVASETGLEFDDDREVRVDMEFGGVCNECDCALDAVEDRFGGLECPSCGAVYGPSIHYPEVREDRGEPADEEEEWPQYGKEMTTKTELFTVTFRYRGRCHCGGEATEMHANVEEPLVGSPSGIVCPDCGCKAKFAAMKHNEVKNPHGDKREVESDA